MIPKLPQKAPNEIVAFDDPCIRYPMLASRKYDGFRVMYGGGENFYTSAAKLFPNRLLWDYFLDLSRLLDQSQFMIDGELWSPNLTFNQMQSCFMSYGHVIDESVRICAFDMMPIRAWDSGDMSQYKDRYEELKAFLSGYPKVEVVEQAYVTNATAAAEYYDRALTQGWEGIILRNPFYGYKHGRSTHLQSIQFKFKQFVTEDGWITGVIRGRRLKGDVERTRNPISGHLERLYEDSAYEPDDIVQGFEVKTEGGITVSVGIGKGFTSDDKRVWWDTHQRNPSHFIGRCVEFKHMPHGAKDRPRIGKLVRFRLEK